MPTSSLGKHWGALAAIAQENQNFDHKCGFGAARTAKTIALWLGQQTPRPWWSITAASGRGSAVGLAHAMPDRGDGALCAPLQVAIRPGDLSYMLLAAGKPQME